MQVRIISERNDSIFGGDIEQDDDKDDEGVDLRDVHKGKDDDNEQDVVDLDEDGKGEGDGSFRLGSMFEVFVVVVFVGERDVCCGPDCPPFSSLVFFIYVLQSST